jgi:hypothetical protein
MEILSPFSEENLKADAAAFRALMRHLREFDGTQNTVIMVQVENEIGMIPDSRDRSELANRLYAGQAPTELIAYLSRNRDSLAESLRRAWTASGNKTSGTWEQVFGAGVATEELFTAWHFAKFTERVTKAGKSEYELPDVRQRGTHPSRTRARTVSQWRTAAALDRCMEGGSAIGRLFVARYLFPELRGMVPPLRCAGKCVFYS